MDVLESLKTILGDRAVPADAVEAARRSHDYMNAGLPPAVVAYPVSTAEVSQVLALCHRRGQPVIPQGGLTGLAGAALPEQPGVVALSLDRMRAIEEIDADSQVMTVQAGAVLQAVQEAADAAGLLFPLDLGGRGSAQVGGLVSTNAGGNRVLRWGMMRDLVLGLEAVLPDGTVVSSLNKMLKNNTGYDLKQLFIGSEGTLGVVTRANLKLFPKPASSPTALCGLASYEAVMALLRRARRTLGPILSAFEVMWSGFYELAADEYGRRPLAGPHAFYVLLDALGSSPEADEALFEGLVAAAIEAGEVEDAVIAQSSREIAELWRMRDLPGEMPRILGPQIPFDVAAPTASLGAYAEAVARRLHAELPAVTAHYFGHVADSNLHVMTTTEDPEAIKAIVYETVRDFGGSVSAEHGIGMEKRAYLAYSRTPAELALMAALKRALDPENILNPGKVLG
jgi:FAD/FMN-containing dehydrogenase